MGKIFIMVISSILVFLCVASGIEHIGRGQSSRKN
jgi:hypothetical protein